MPLNDFRITLVEKPPWKILHGVERAEASMIGVDFFCGAGGTTRGFLDAGVDVLGGIDNDPTARESYEQNIRPGGTNCRFLYRDIGVVSADEITTFIGPRCAQPLLFTGCPPCQPFTNLKTDKANQGDAHRLLLKFFVQIETVLPDYVVVENVPGIRNNKYGSIFDDFITGLHRLGYETDCAILDAKDFGVPQSRRRMIAVGSRLGAIRLPAPTHGPRRDIPYQSAATAFRFPPLPAGACHLYVPNHQTAALSEINQRRIEAVALCGGSRRDWPTELALPCYLEHDGHTDVYGRIDPAKPAPTLTTRFNSLSNGRFGHPVEHRAISLREGAALQTFPDDYLFCAPSAKRIAQHIGNAVPVRLARVLGECVLAHYENLGDARPYPHC